MTRVRLLGLAVAAAALAASSGSAGLPRLHGANFWVKCRFSHINNDDPIVFPRQAGRSHSHTFFGNLSTDAFSTPASLRAGRTNCKRLADTAAYWVPTLYHEGKEVRPASIGVYHFMKTADRVHPFPAGLRIVAGNSRAVRPQSKRVAYWTCWGATGPSPTVPTCPKARGQDGIRPALTLHVIFPNCWDGKHLDSLDHESHMAYAVNYVCPRSHPVQVPGLTYLIAYPIYGGPVELSSGGVFSGHGDFVNAWNQRVLERIVSACTLPTAKADCADKAEG